MKKILLLISFSLSIGYLFAQNDPFQKLLTEAAKHQVQKKILPQKTISTSNPLWQALAKAPINTTPLTYVDKNNNPLAVDKMVTLPDGSQITAREYIDRLNELEKKLNEKGYTLRNSPQTQKVSKMVTTKTFLADKVLSLPKLLSPIKTKEELARLMKPERSIGGLTLKPVGSYTNSEAEVINKNNFALNGAGSISFTSAGTRPPLVKPALPPGTMVGSTPKPKLLKAFNGDDTKEWAVGNPEVLSAGIKATLNRTLKIFPFDPESPETSLSEFKFRTEGKVYASLFGNSLNLFEATGEFYAPQFAAKKMTAKIQVTALGITIFNLDESYQQSIIVQGFKGREVDYSIPIDIPIAWGFNFTGKVGIKGRVGFAYDAGIYRTLLTASVQPLAELKAYAEAGVSIFGVVKIGAGGTLTLIKAEIDLRALAGIWAQNSGQIVMGENHWFTANINMLSGLLYLYVELCVPDWVPFVGGECKRFEHDLFYWEGYNIAATIAEGGSYSVIPNTWVYEQMGMSSN